VAVYEKSIKIKELEKQLNSVLNDKDTQKDGVVVSIEGPWGVGKTYFWHDYVSRYNIFGKNLSTNQKATEYIHYKNTIYQR
jgi:predicted AAA+ superfamily ATPase